MCIRDSGYSAAVRVTFTDDFDSGKIQIKKVSSLDSNTTLQASFKVQQKQADGTYADYPNSQNPLILTTGTNGTVTSGWLPAGDYQLIEQSVTGQYLSLIHISAGLFGTLPLGIITMGGIIREPAREKSIEYHCL